MNVIIITGASSGMGWEFARQLDQGLRTIEEFWLIARRGERLKELSEKLRHKTRIFAMDLTDSVQLDTFQRTLERECPVIRMLINSSGYGVMGNVADLETREQLGMIDLNCRALTHMTHICLPFMKRGSRIIQLASSAAFLPQPGFAVYAAGKSYVLSFSRALGEELREKGIFVTAVCPGPVRTEFFERAERKASTLAIKKICDGGRKGCGGRCPLRIRQTTSLSGIQPADPGLRPADKTVSPFADPHDNAVS